ncbi:hypothetical protein L249_0940, partial [Ophiocordyceps polyrhachis-furcata BCC 54312]
LRNLRTPSPYSTRPFRLISKGSGHCRSRLRQTTILPFRPTSHASPTTRRASSSPSSERSMPTGACPTKRSALSLNPFSRRRALPSWRLPQPCSSGILVEHGPGLQTRASGRGGRASTTGGRGTAMDRSWRSSVALSTALRPSSPMATQAAPLLSTRRHSSPTGSGPLVWPTFETWLRWRTGVKGFSGPSQSTHPGCMVTCHCDCFTRCWSSAKDDQYF